MKKSTFFKLLFLGSCMLFSGCNNPGGTISYAESPITDPQIISSSDYPDDVAESIPEAEIYLSVQGCILHPGVYSMPEGTRLFELINEAGGTTDDGDTTKLNLARALVDGEQVIIPSKTTESEDAFSLAEGKLSGNGLVDINQASLSELMTLNGIGETRAGAIISYRDENGPFGCIDDLKNVEGIKDGIFEGLKDRICVR